MNRIAKGNPQGAVADLTRAVRLKPEESAAYLDLAKAYQEQHRLAEAAEQLNRAVALTAPAGLAAVYRSRAKVDQQQNNLEAAVRDLELAAPLEPEGKASAAARGRFCVNGPVVDARRQARGGRSSSERRPGDHGG